MSRDLTAILLRGGAGVPKPPEGQAPEGQPPGASPAAEDVAITPAWIEGVVRERGRPTILRIAPLPAVGLLQVEVADASDGLPTEDPALIGALSARGQATFVHVNHEAQQAIVHGFDAGTPGEGFVGTPGPEFEEKLRARLGCDLAALHAADDQSRAGIGVVSSRTAALLPGRSLALPVGMPSALGSFAFHDRAADTGSEAERCAFFAFDRPLIGALTKTPGAELARIIEGARPGAPSDPEVAQMVGVLRGLGERTLEAADPGARRDLVRAIEMLVLGSGRVFAGGDLASYWDERVLPLVSLQDSEPVVDEDDLEALSQAQSLVHALVEIVPASAPPGGVGAVLESIGDTELSPLLPAFVEEGVYAGSILQLDPTRLVAALRKLDGERLSAAVARVERAWFTRKTGQPAEGEAFEAFRRERAEAGQPDVDRVLRHLSEVRIVLEVAAVNDLAVALAFYG